MLYYSLKRVGSVSQKSHTLLPLEGTQQLPIKKEEKKERKKEKRKEGKKEGKKEKRKKGKNEVRKEKRK